MARTTCDPLKCVDISDWRFAEISACWRGGVSASQFGFCKMSDWYDARKRTGIADLRPPMITKLSSAVSLVMCSPEMVKVLKGQAGTCMSFKRGHVSNIILCANNLEELKVGLAALDISVPARSDRRESPHVERYCIAHLLATLPAAKLFFPLTLNHRDKPDFLLEMSNRSIGIEHTEAVPVNAARSQVLRERGLGPDVYFIPHATPREPKKSAEELRREIEADAPGGAWGGDSPEYEWAAAMAHCGGEKLLKAMDDGFVRYPTNWLLIYDNWPLPGVNFAKAALYLAPLLASMDAYSVFDAVFIHDDSAMCEFREEPIIHALVKPGH
ncbi:hypothetical protein KVQ82_12140 [Pseudomonas sp. AO-1]|jgi:hypothetical protein|uniref:hypothetical protein n=1 Tax=Pseudomonas sp. AO-1 TaxID=2855434 RepID=UPI001C74835D|nr:hypothetical protein [Pseudomonas sp. AO-1]QXZ16616.1 hypothetical protein KVQ82_12140 [Pseudomonas sp. AO-1]